MVQTILIVVPNVLIRSRATAMKPQPKIVWEVAIASTPKWVVTAKTPPEEHGLVKKKTM
jgi:hypothetical protein